MRGQDWEDATGTNTRMVMEAKKQAGKANRTKKDKTKTKGDL